MRAVYFDMIEYFCNSHDDTAVDVIQYDCDELKISTKTFSWSMGCGETSSEGIWRVSNEYIQKLQQEGIQLRTVRKL